MNSPHRDEDQLFTIPAYHAFLSPAWARHLLATATPFSPSPTTAASQVPSTWLPLDGLRQIGPSGGLESPAALRFLLTLYTRVQPLLAQVLHQRQRDRQFIDERTRACFAYNQRLGMDITDAAYRTVIGLADAAGRVVVGPLRPDYAAAGGAPVAPIPAHLRGPHVTLFGPPDSAKLAINAMNAYHRTLPGEPPLVAELLRSLPPQPSGPIVPMWGADDEDSKTPLRQDLIDAGANLTACFDGTLVAEDAGKRYELAAAHRSLPLKRFPGLALPCSFLFYQESPIPLHLYDFALHLFHNFHNEKALSFYVPKLENEEEAKYLHKMIETAEHLVKEMHPAYQIGTVRVLIVLENPRAILRTHEIIDALHPYFAGASLGWHDYLAATARLFREDGNYRIPVKADPNIVIKYIKASHSMLAEVVGSRGGIKVGGMYGILPLHNDLHSASFQITLRGFFKDVLTQLKRGLTGFWVAHPDFVRLGMAIVAAWQQHEAGDQAPLFALTQAILRPAHREEVDALIRGQDLVGLDASDPRYVRSLLVADIKESDFIANHHPDEIRYNVFQSLQYLTDWLCGNGCVALPTVIENIPVRVMDDLATAERSRWEVWHEIRHNRFKLEEFLRIAHEEMRFIRKDLSDDKKIVQVKYNSRTAKWYPIAFHIMIQLMTSSEPVEFATELLLPFTVEEIRQASDPLCAALAIDPAKYALAPAVARWNDFFASCGAARFATAMAQLPAFDAHQVQSCIASFSVAEIIEAAGFHGNIGESPRTLDHLAQREQKLVSDGDAQHRQALADLGTQYLEKFGFKFLVSARGKTPSELLQIVQARLQNPREVEIAHAKQALTQIALHRLAEAPPDRMAEALSQLRHKHGIAGAQIALCARSTTQTLCLGEAVVGQAPVGPDTLFELASLSKTLASAFALEFFAQRGIRLSRSVNDLFALAGSPDRLVSAGDPAWADRVTLQHLLGHQALNRHYVQGFPSDGPLPSIASLLRTDPGSREEPILVLREPGTRFQYSGAGFLVLEHLLECLAGCSIQELFAPFFAKLGLSQLTFQQRTSPGRAYADGYFDSGDRVPSGRLMFPACAAGALGTATDMLTFLRQLGRAFGDENGAGPLSHDTAVQLVQGRDLGCRAFMGCDVGLGVFVIEAGDNRVLVHQGANEGFRAIYVYVLSGPDADTGFVVLCNGDNRGVLFIAEVAQCLIKLLPIRGVDVDKFSTVFDYSKLDQAQIVNLGYKTLVFDAFLPTLPEAISHHGAVHSLSPFNLLTDATIVRVSNQRFARAENLFSPFVPVFDPVAFGRQGKIMDSWETARHNDAACDELDLLLREPGPVRYVYLSTRFHDGNQAQFVRILGRRRSVDDWEEILPRLPLQGHAQVQIDLLHSVGPYTAVRVQLFPDGGLSRLGLYPTVPDSWKSAFVPVQQAQCIRDPDPVPTPRKPLTIPYQATPREIQQNLTRCAGHDIDWACAAFGGRLLRATNEHYGPAIQLISPFPPLHMFDGLESARSRDPDHQEEVVIALGRAIVLGRVVFDFTYFVNNNPRDVQVFARQDTGWLDVTGRISVKPFAANRKTVPIVQSVTTDQLMIRTFPDGGINRVQVFARTP